MILSIAVSFILTMILYKRDMAKQIKNNDAVSVKEQEVIKTVTINTPLKGRVAPINEAPDEIFAQKMMGDGVVIFPTGNILVAPVDGQITMIFPSKHAIGLKTDSGVEILIHIGLDTVKLEGKPFTLLVNEGQIVKQGEKLMEVDFKMIKEAGYSTATPMVITSKNQFEIINLGDNELNQKIIELI